MSYTHSDVEFRVYKDHIDWFPPAPKVVFDGGLLSYDDFSSLIDWSEGVDEAHFFFPIDSPFAISIAKAAEWAIKSFIAEGAKTHPGNAFDFKGPCALLEDKKTMRAGLAGLVYPYLQEFLVKEKLVNEARTLFYRTGFRRVVDPSVSAEISSYLERYPESKALSDAFFHDFGFSGIEKEPIVTSPGFDDPQISSLIKRWGKGLSLCKFLFSPSRALDYFAFHGLMGRACSIYFPQGDRRFLTHFAFPCVLSRTALQHELNGVGVHGHIMCPPFSEIRKNVEGKMDFFNKVDSEVYAGSDAVESMSADIQKALSLKLKKVRGEFEILKSKKEGTMTLSLKTDDTGLEARQSLKGFVDSTGYGSGPSPVIHNSKTVGFEARTSHQYGQEGEK